jgi:hypothetical protein
MVIYDRRESRMKKLTGGLIVAAVALGVLAVRNARRAITGDAAGQPGPSTPPGQATGVGQSLDEGMVIRRNERLDESMVIQSPFQGDPGIVAQARNNGRS